MRLYEKGDLSQALRTAREFEATVPGYRDEAIFLQACLGCKLGRPDEGMASLRRLAESGGWYSWEHLSWDPDLETIRPREEFKALGPLFEDRRKAAEKNSSPRVIRALPPPLDSKPRGIGALLVLHGRGQEAPGTLEKWTSATRSGWGVFSLQSSQPYTPGSYQWDDEERSRSDLRAGLQAVRETPGVEPDAPILGGYSQGALVGLRAMLAGALPGSRRAILVSPSTRIAVDKGEETLAWVRQAKLTGWAIYTLSGEEDFSLGFQRKLHEQLLAAGAQSDLVVIPGEGHDYPKSFPQLLETALHRVRLASDPGSLPK